MSDKESITFRCDADILEALDNLGRECYHAKTPHRYDRSKILMNILRLNIEALSDCSIVLPGTVEVRQSASDNLEERITEIIKASGAIEQIRAEVNLSIFYTDRIKLCGLLAGKRKTILAYVSYY